ncbi:MAG: hypothetical protein WBP81_05435, partial [Solirubrobacteraceae bacterium]
MLRRIEHPARARGRRGTEDDRELAGLLRGQQQRRPRGLGQSLDSWPESGLQARAERDRVGQH